MASMSTRTSFSQAAFTDTLSLPAGLCAGGVTDHGEHVMEVVGLSLTGCCLVFRVMQLDTVMLLGVMAIALDLT